MQRFELTSIQLNADKARAFVLAQGGARDKARLEGIFGAPASREIARELETLQNPDGGFPAMGQHGGPSSVDATCYLLHQLKDLPPLSGSPMASRGVAFLRRVQQPEGFWRESAEAADTASPWAQPDNPSAAPYLTANAAFTILTLEPEHLDPVKRAVAWLKGVITAGQGTEENQTLGLCWGLFCKVLGLQSQETAMCFEICLQRDLPAYELAWFLACGLEAGAGGKFLLPIASRLGRLAAAQQEDGSWPAEPWQAVESTLTALRVFRGYGVIQEGSHVGR